MARESGIVIKRMLGVMLSEQYRIALAFHFNGRHLQGQRRQAHRMPVLSYVRKDHADVFRAAEEIVKVLRERYAGRRTGRRGGASRQPAAAHHRGQRQILRCGMLVICHGLGGARTMAKVANNIVGKEYVQYLDITELSTEAEVAEAIEEKLSRMNEYGSIAVMADTELRPICRNLHDGDRSVTVMDNISTSMVIEAALLAVEHRATAEQIRLHLQQLAPGYQLRSGDAAPPFAQREAGDRDRVHFGLRRRRQTQEHDHAAL